MLSIHFFSNYSQKRFNLILRKTFGNEVENLDRINFFILIYLFMDFFSSLGTELVQHKPHKNRLRNFSKRISNADVEFEKEEPWDFFPPLFPRNKFAFRAYKRLNVFTSHHSPRAPVVCVSPTPSRHLHGRSSRFHAKCLNPIPCNRSRGVESVRLAGAPPFRADNAARLAERHPTPPARTRLTQQAAT